MSRITLLMKKAFVAFWNEKRRVFKDRWENKRSAERPKSHEFVIIDGNRKYQRVKLYNINIDNTTELHNIVCISESPTDK